jgi:hypothetical protein
MAATSEMISSIVRLLEKRGLVGPDEFANALEAGADWTEKDAANSPFPPGFPRFDVAMMRQTAAILKKKKKTGGWRPVVIDGGLSQQDNPDKSD